MQAIQSIPNIKTAEQIFGSDIRSIKGEQQQNARPSCQLLHEHT